jgi:RND family efflux transporter MFP subunit
MQALLLLLLGGVQTALAGSEPDAIIGYTEPYHIITISSAESGVLEEVLVREGDSVKARQIVARLETQTLEAELDIARAEAQLQATRLKRIENLASEKRASPDELDRARTDAEIKRAQVRRIEAQIENRTLRSPIDGIVTEIKRDPSESVSAANPHVLTVVHIDRLLLNLHLPPARAAALAPGEKAVVRFIDNGEKVAGEVDFISPVTDAASGTVRVKFVFDNRDRKLRSGAACTLDTSGH